MYNLTNKKFFFAILSHISIDSKDDQKSGIWISCLRSWPLWSPGELRSQVDGVWNAFWSGRISNPMEVIEQDYLSIIYTTPGRPADTRRKQKPFVSNSQLNTEYFLMATTNVAYPYEKFRWSRFKHFEAREMFNVNWPERLSIFTDDWVAMVLTMLRAYERRNALQSYPGTG